MTILMQRMREELVRRTYSETTIRSYLHAVEAFRRLADLSEQTRHSAKPELSHGQISPLDLGPGPGGYLTPSATRFRPGVRLRLLLAIA